MVVGLVEKKTSLCCEWRLLTRLHKAIMEPGSHKHLIITNHHYPQTQRADRVVEWWCYVCVHARARVCVCMIVCILVCVCVCVCLCVYVYEGPLTREWGE